MRSGIIILLTTVLLSTNNVAFAQEDLKTRQEKLEHAIKDAYKNKEITYLEYEKLMKEQDIIKKLRATCLEDEYLEANEKDAIHNKLVRAKSRLKRYKTNKEK